MEQLFVLLVFGAIALAKWAIERAGSGTDAAPPKPPRAGGPAVRRTPAANSEEERMRKLMEALGVPPGNVPPRRVAPRAQTPERPLAPVRPPASPMYDIGPRPRRRSIPAEAAPVRPREVVVVQAPPPVAAPARPAAPAPESAPLEPAVAEFLQTETIQTPFPAVRSPAADVRALLRTNATLRDAIVLREVLGPPRGLSGF